jgi:hypothetical protein
VSPPIPPPVNLPPSANGEPNLLSFSFSTGDPTTTQKCAQINVLANDSDPEGGQITAEAVSANFSNAFPNGTYYQLSSNGAFSICATRGARNTYTTLSVIYRTRDSSGLASSNNASVNIKLNLT